MFSHKFYTFATPGSCYFHYFAALNRKGIKVHLQAKTKKKILSKMKPYSSSVYPIAEMGFEPQPKAHGSNSVTTTLWCPTSPLYVKKKFQYVFDESLSD